MSSDISKSGDDTHVSRHASDDVQGDVPRSTSVVTREELEGRTLYEKKCILIDREIEAMGMGKYQWCLWGLCGFGYLLDLLWAEAFGLVLGPLGQELNILGMALYYIDLLQKY